MPRAGSGFAMAHRKQNRHELAPERSTVVLLLIDVINPLDFPEAGQLLRYIPSLTRRISRLTTRARAAGVPVIYVNDNFGRWRSDFRKQVQHCLAKGSRGCEMVRQLAPGETDYFVLKPKHSGFFATTLDPLLRDLGARRLILTGIAGNSCVLFTANDAYMRDYELLVPADCVASNKARDNRHALELMKNFLKAKTGPSTKIAFPKKRRRASGRAD
jgi:nicotinamidase-related amidase